MIENIVMTTPVGQLGLRCQDAKLVAVDFLSPQVVSHPSSSLSLSARNIVKQFQHFFDAPTTAVLDVPYAFLTGTAFQRRVWQALRKIPRGQLRTYGQLADQLGSSARAIGGACRANPLPIFIPCHRVVGKQGLGGYCGATEGEKLAVKQWLLTQEGLV